MLVSGQAGRSKDLLQWAKQSPPPVVTRPDPGDSPRPAPPVPPQQPTKTIDTTPKVASTVSIAAPTSKAPQMAAPPPSLPESTPLPAKPTKPSKWWMLLLIIPAIATGLAVVASQFQPARRTLFKNFRRRWTNWQARLAEKRQTHGRPSAAQVAARCPPSHSDKTNMSTLLHSHMCTSVPETIST